MRFRLVNIFKSMKVTLAATLLFAGGSNITQAADNFGENTREIAPGVYSFRPIGSHYFSMFMVTDDGVAVFETVNSKHSTAML